MIIQLSPSQKFSMPVLDSERGYATAESLVAAAAGHKLPGPVSRSLARLKEKSRALDQALSRRNVAVEPSPAREADRAEDAAWRAIFFFVTAFSLIRGPSKTRPRAEAVLATLFPEGLGFLKLSYASEWARAHAMMTQIEQHGIGDEIVALGGRELLDNLKAVHAHYGQAIGVTAPRPPRRRAPSNLAGPRKDVVHAIRDYAVKVAAHVEEDEPHTAALAETLLAPLVELERGRARRPARGAPIPSPAAG